MCHVGQRETPAELVGPARVQKEKERAGSNSPDQCPAFSPGEMPEQPLGVKA
jgi:hypothetical protein